MTTKTDKSIGFEVWVQRSVDSEDSREGDEIAAENNFTIPSTADYAFGTYKNKPISDATRKKLKKEVK